MADETTPTTPETPTIPETPETAEAGGTATATAEEPVKLKQEVEIKDVGPCKKHVKVTVNREQIDERFDEKYTELVQSDQPQVRGFRPGKAPRKLIEKQYHEAVSEEVKTQVLMASLEQLADEQQHLAPQPAGPRSQCHQHSQGRAVHLRVRHRGAARVRSAGLQGAEAPPTRPQLHRGRGRGREDSGFWSLTASSCPRRATRPRSR